LISFQTSPILLKRIFVGFDPKPIPTEFNRSKVGCGLFRKEGMGLTGKVEVADEFCEFYSQVGPKLVAKIKRERKGAFLDYMGDRVRESFFWRPTTPLEVEEIFGSLNPHKGIVWDEVSP
jgi:hypothetical protein